jgi:hypothetical protein
MGIRLTELELGLGLSLAKIPLKFGLRWKCLAQINKRWKTILVFLKTLVKVNRYPNPHFPLPSHMFTIVIKG